MSNLMKMQPYFYQNFCKFGISIVRYVLLAVQRLPKKFFVANNIHWTCSETAIIVIPAHAGTLKKASRLDSCLRRNDGLDSMSNVDGVRGR